MASRVLGPGGRPLTGAWRGQLHRRGHPQPSPQMPSGQRLPSGRPQRNALQIPASVIMTVTNLKGALPPFLTVSIRAELHHSGHDFDRVPLTTLFDAAAKSLALLLPAGSSLPPTDPAARTTYVSRRPCAPTKDKLVEALYYKVSIPCADQAQRDLLVDAVLAQGALPLDIPGWASSHASLLHGAADPAAAHFLVEVAAPNPDIWSAQAVFDLLNYQDRTSTVWVALLRPGEAVVADGAWAGKPGCPRPVVSPLLWPRATPVFLALVARGHPFISACRHGVVLPQLDDTTLDLKRLIPRLGRPAAPVPAGTSGGSSTGPGEEPAVDEEQGQAPRPAAWGQDGATAPTAGQAAPPPASTQLPASPAPADPWPLLAAAAGPSQRQPRQPQRQVAPVGA